MRPVSRRVREEAIWALTMCADERIRGLFTATWDLLGRFPSPPSDRLADAAFRAVPARLSMETWGIYLEAAALLRDGWNVGDPVELRGAK